MYNTTIKALICVGIFLIHTSTNAQHVKVTEGDLKKLRGIDDMGVEFRYDSMLVAKYPNEEAYIREMTLRWNGKTPGKGDEYADLWVSSRSKSYEPSFTYYFSKISGLNTRAATPEYTLRVWITHTEPGWNIGIGGKNATIEGEAWIVRTGTSDEVVAKIMFTQCAANNATMGDFETFQRLAEAYATAGTEIGKLLKAKLKR